MTSVSWACGFSLLVAILSILFTFYRPPSLPPNLSNTDLRTYLELQFMAFKYSTPYQVLTYGPSHDDMVLVLDLPQDEVYKSWLSLSRTLEWSISKGGFPGSQAPLPHAIMSSVTEAVSPWVEVVFRKRIKPSTFVSGFVGQMCRDPDGSPLKESQYLPHADSGLRNLVSVHYLSDTASWPHGGGTGFFKHRATGNTRIDKKLCEKASYYFPDSHYTFTCRDNFPLLDPDLGRPKVESDPTKDFPGVTGEYGEYDIIEVVPFKPNRIVIYMSYQLHSAVIGAEGQDALSCDFAADTRRAAFSYQWTGRTASERRKWRKV